MDAGTKYREKPGARIGSRPCLVPQLGKIDIRDVGPRIAGRRECAVNSEPPKAAENFRRANLLRPSADEIKSGGVPRRGTEPKKEGILSFDKIPSFLPLLGKIDIFINALGIKELGYQILISVLIIVGGLVYITSHIIWIMHYKTIKLPQP